MPIRRLRCGYMEIYRFSRSGKLIREFNDQ